MKHIFKLGITVVSSLILLSGCAASDMQTLVSGGGAIPASSVKHSAVSADHVKLYYSNLNAPKHYQIVGHISANNDSLVGVPHSQQTIATELKKQAASLGANGVINISAGLEQTTADAILSR